MFFSNMYFLLLFPPITESLLFLLVFSLLEKIPHTKTPSFNDIHVGHWEWKGSEGAFSRWLLQGTSTKQVSGQGRREQEKQIERKREGEPCSFGLVWCKAFPKVPRGSWAASTEWFSAWSAYYTGNEGRVKKLDQMAHAKQETLIICR